MQYTAYYVLVYCIVYTPYTIYPPYTPYGGIPEGRGRERLATGIPTIYTFLPHTFGDFAQFDEESTSNIYPRQTERVN